MKFYDRIKIIFKKLQSTAVETIVIQEKQCPHCVNRGMFIFDSTHKSKKEKSVTNEFHK
jgi:hypothetical protein